jgi:hypothetical protein
MDNKTLVALKGSVEKWQKIVDRSGIDYYADNCPLCTLFNLPGMRCKDCPVRDKTKLHACGKTPYSEWSNHHRREHPYCSPRKIQCTTCEQLAREELEFLKSLLPIKEEVKMKFVIRDDKQKEDVEVELYLRAGGAYISLCVENNGRSKTILTLQNGKFRKSESADLEGIQTDDAGRILEDK